MKLARFVIVLIAFVWGVTAFAADGDLDPTFGVGGKVTLDITDHWDSIDDVVVLNDGSVLVAGWSANMQDLIFDAMIAKFDTNGNLVNDFGTGGVVVTDFDSNGTARAAAIHALPNGKFLVAGIAHGDFLLAQFNADGTPDIDFGVGGNVTTDIGFSDGAFAVAVQSTGRIVVAGIAEFPNDRYIGLAGYTSDGILDSTFGINGIMNMHVAGIGEILSDMILLDDDRILVTGDVGMSFNPPVANAVFVVRYLSNGFPDPSFSDNGASVIDLTPGGDTSSAIAVQADGKIVIGGYVVEGPFDGTQDLALVRLDSEGNLDSTFGNGGVVIQDLGGDLLPGNDRIHDLSIQNDGKFVAIGTSDLLANTFDFLLTRFEANGDLDITFNGGVIFTSFGQYGDEAYSVFLTDDSIVAAGSGYVNGPYGDMAIARYLKTPNPPPPGDCTGALFCDLFDDDVLSPDWSYLKPSWNEASGSLTGMPSGRKAIAIAPNGWSSSNVYSIQTTMKVSGGEFSSVWLLGWYQDKKNTIELQMKEGNDKWTLKHRVNGVVVAKAKGLKTILPNTVYSVKVSFDGSQFQVFVDDANTPLITLQATHPVSAGTIGYQVKNTAASFDSIRVD